MPDVKLKDKNGVSHTYQDVYGTKLYNPQDQVEEFFQPSGLIEIHDLNETDVRSKASAQIVDANLSANNIAEGVTILGITGTFHGGSSSSPDPKDVNFFDYDGTIAYSYTRAEFALLNELPAVPGHDGLISQGWNWTLELAQNYVANYGRLAIGPLYITDDGATRIYFHLFAPLLSPYLGLAINGSVSVDWGDGTSRTTMSGSSLTSVRFQQHTYMQPGIYVISIYIVSGNFTFYNTSGTGYERATLLTSNGVSGGNASQEYLRNIYRIEFGNGITRIGQNGLAGCYIKYLVMSKNITIIGSYAFRDARYLTLLPFSPDLNYSSSGAIEVYGMVRVIFAPKNNIVIASLGLYSNGSTYFCPEFFIPSNVDSIGGTFGATLKGVNLLIIPKNITSLAQYALQSMSALRALVFTKQTPPIANGNSVFASLPTACIIYVPNGSLSAYTSAANYPSPSTYTYQEYIDLPF